MHCSYGTNIVHICSICIVRSAFQVAAWIIVSLLYLLQAPIWEGQGGWREACVSDRPLPMLNPRQDLLCFLPRSFWPRIFFSKMYKKRCEDGRNPSMRSKEMRGDEDRRITCEGRRRLQGHRQRRLSSRGWSLGGGDQAAAALPLDLGESSEQDEDGDFSPECAGRARFHGDTGLTRAANPRAAGFQICMLDSARKISGWAAGPGKRRGSPPGSGLPN